MSRTPAILLVVLLSTALASAPAWSQRLPDKSSPAITEVFLADYAAAPFVARFRAPQFTFFNGDLVVVRGRNFGARGDRSVRLRVNGRSAEMLVSVWSDTLIRATVPGGRDVGLAFQGSEPQRRDFVGEIGIAEKKSRGWWSQPIRAAFVWNFQRVGDRDRDGIKDVRYGGTDCDDRDGDNYPGNPEIADDLGHDEDCDPTTIGHRDRDEDGYVDAAVYNWVRGRITARGRDCDDLRTNVNPRSVEACNGRDDNCDGWIDEELLNCPTANRRVGGGNGAR